MKKVLVLVLALAMCFAMAGCASTKEDINAKSEGVMTYEEYMAAATDDAVVIEGYIQGIQVYAAEWGNTSLYLQDGDGAYFVYRLSCTQEEYDSFEVGKKIKISGFKSEWAGEVEVADATFELEDGSYIAEATDVTALVGTDELAAEQNKFVVFTDCVVESEAIYNWDGSGQDGDDLYFNVTVNGVSCSFTVETDECPAGSEVYEAVKALKVGDTVDMEGFLYWYEGANPHITAVK